MRFPEMNRASAKRQINRAAKNLREKGLLDHRWNVSQFIGRGTWERCYPLARLSFCRGWFALPGLLARWRGRLYPIKWIGKPREGRWLGDGEITVVEPSAQFRYTMGVMAFSTFNEFTPSSLLTWRNLMNRYGCWREETQTGITGVRHYPLKRFSSAPVSPRIERV